MPILSIIGMAGFLLIVEIAAILLAYPVQASGISGFQDPDSLGNVAFFIATLIAFTVLIILLLKYHFRKMIVLIIGVSVFFALWYVYYAIASLLFSFTDFVVILATMTTIISTILLFVYPEWYVIDFFGVFISAGIAAIFGTTISVIPVIILLALLATYDAISVYKTKHMLTLAQGVLDLKVPLLFLVPKRKDFSYIKEGVGRVGNGEKTQRGAFLMGMGDMIMPSILLVSANIFLPFNHIMGIVSVPVLFAMGGSIIGLITLMHFVSKGNPQAGLPLLNGGSIIGLLVGVVLTTVVLVH